MEGNVGPHTDDAVLLQRTPHPPDGLGTRITPHDEFGNHRVIKWRDLKTWIDSSVYTHARTGGQETVCNASSGRQEVVVWVLCVDPTLNGMPVELYVLLLVAQRTPARHSDLLLDNINTRHHFRHRVLHLQARVHLKEIKIFILVEQEFDCARIDVIHSLGSFDSDTTYPLAQLVIQGRRERLFQ